MKSFCCLFFLILWAFPSYGQALISNGGGYHKNASGSLTFSIGEPLTATFSAGSHILTQGFNQTRMTITSLDKNQSGLSDIKAWPNPTHQFINLKQNESKGSHALLFDGAGKLVNDFPLSSQTNSIDLRAYSNGSYTLRVLDKKEKNLKSFRVVIAK